MDDCGSYCRDALPSHRVDMMRSWQIAFLNRSLGAWATEWDALNRRINAGHPLLDSRFVDPLLKHFGHGDEVLCIHRPEPSLAIDGMCILRPGRVGFWTSFCPSQAPISPLLLKDGAVLQDLLRCLPGVAIVLDLLNLDPDYQLLHMPADLPCRELDHAVTINVSLDGSFEQYWQGRSKNLVKNVRRYLGRATQGGEALSCSIVDQQIKMRDAVARFGELESGGWKGREGTAVHVHNQQGRFYLDLMERFSTSGQAFAYEYWLEERLAASRLNIVGPEMTVILKTSYDESLSEISPGQLLLNALLQHEFRLGGRSSVEFYTNASKEQLSWATGHRTIRHISVYRTPLISRLIYCLDLVKKSVLGGMARGNERVGRKTIAVKEFVGLDSLPSEFRQLLDNAESKCPSQGVAWYRNFEDSALVEGGEVSFLAAEMGGAPVAVLPLRLSGPAKRREAASLSSFYTWLYAPAFGELVTDATVANMISYLEINRRSLGVMRLAPMDPDADSFRMLERGLRITGWVSFRYFCFGNWYHEFGGQGWVEYLGGRSGELRSTIKRKGKKFASEGGTLEIVTTGAEVATALEAYQQIYAASWKRQEPFPAFIPGLVLTAAAKGWLRLGVARLNGVPIAAQIWLVAQGTAYIYKLAYDEKHASWSSGTLLTAHLMQHVMEVDRVERVDFLIGDDAYKPQWMNKRRERYGIVAYNPRTLHGFFGLLREAAGRGGKSLLRWSRS